MIHDETVDRTTDGTGLLSQFSIAQLQQLDAGKGQQIPLLTQVVDLIDQRAVLNIELKDSASAPLVLALIEDYVNRGWSLDNFIVSSFFHHDLHWLKQQYPALRIGVLSAGVGMSYAVFAQELSAYSINLCGESINQQIIDDAHQRQLKVMVYTVNSASQCLALQAMGVDGIFTDFPSDMINLLA